MYGSPVFVTAASWARRAIFSAVVTGEIVMCTPFAGRFGTRESHYCDPATRPGCTQYQTCGRLMQFDIPHLVCGSLPGSA
jgi:hypothetical protein